MEIDDHYGVTLAALAVGVAPGDYSKSQQAMIGINRLRTFLNANPTPSLHHRVMLAWCSKRIDGLMSEEARQKLIKELWASQLVDGGWSIAAMLADWSDFRRKDSQAQQLQSADAYATGLVLVVLRELGVPSDDERIQSALIGYLKIRKSMENGSHPPHKRQQAVLYQYWIRFRRAGASSRWETSQLAL